MSVRRRARIALPAVVTMVLGAVLAVAPIGVEAADSATSPSSGPCTSAGHQVSCTYSYTGAEQSLAVPADAFDVHASAVGAAGAASSTYVIPPEIRRSAVSEASTTASGGEGGTAAAALHDVSGRTLYIEVGGTPTASSGDCQTGVECDGGFNGGGSGYLVAGGGGGASDVRTVSMVPTDTKDSLASRLVVAGGGGGAGSGDATDGSGLGGNGGAAGKPGDDGGTGGGAGGGQPGTTTSDGAGGVNSVSPSADGDPGSADTGGAGGTDPITKTSGGGGGGGYFGAGGGAAAAYSGIVDGARHVATDDAAVYSAAGGGGGASYPTAGSSTTSPASVTITYRLPASPTLSTEASPGVALGASIHDTAFLRHGSSPGGTITFDVYGPDDATCASSPASTSTATVHGNGSYTSGSYRPTAPGTYRYVARYSGDGGNHAVSGSCGAAGESVVVRTVTPELRVSLTAVPHSQPAPGGPVDLDVVVSNPSDVDPITVTGYHLSGPETPPGSSTTQQDASVLAAAVKTCATTLVGTTIAPGRSAPTCVIHRTIDGAAGSRFAFTIVARGKDPLGQRARASDSALVGLSGTASISDSVTNSPPPTGTPLPVTGTDAAGIGGAGLLLLGIGGLLLLAGRRRKGGRHTA